MGGWVGGCAAYDVLLCRHVHSADVCQCVPLLCWRVHSAVLTLLTCLLSLPCSMSQDGGGYGGYDGRASSRMGGYQADSRGPSASGQTPTPTTQQQASPTAMAANYMAAGHMAVASTSQAGTRAEAEEESSGDDGGGGVRMSPGGPFEIGRAHV